MTNWGKEETMRLLKQAAELKRIREELEAELRFIETIRLVKKAEMIANGME